MMNLAFFWSAQRNWLIVDGLCLSDVTTLWRCRSGEAARRKYTAELQTSTDQNTTSEPESSSSLQPLTQYVERTSRSVF